METSDSENEEEAPICIQYYPLPFWVCLLCMGIMGLVQVILGCIWLSGCNELIYVSVYLIVSGLMDFALLATARFHKRSRVQCTTYAIPIRCSFTTILWVVRVVCLLGGLVWMIVSVHKININPELACTENETKFALASAIIGFLFTAVILTGIVGRNRTNGQPET
ncbi:hypothetical protein ScPMuIL_002855 [Solemya velum]